MFNFFLKNTSANGEVYSITGKDFNHAKNVLRLKVGDEILISSNGKSDLCTITNFTESEMLAKVVKESAIISTLPVSITLFQGLPKADKLELVIQKAVELGVDSIVPVQMKNCVVKIEEKKKDAKRERWQSISESASKQCKRSAIANVLSPTSFNESLSLLKDLDLVIVPYESQSGMTSTINALSSIKKGMRIGVFIGPEGGFDKSEIDALISANATTVSLGKRILRTETAAITALSMLMLYAEMKLD